MQLSKNSGTIGWKWVEIKWGFRMKFFLTEALRARGGRKKVCKWTEIGWNCGKREFGFDPRTCAKGKRGMKNQE